MVDRDSARLQQIYDSQAVKRVHVVALQLYHSESALKLGRVIRVSSSDPVSTLFRVSYKLKVKSIGLAEI